MKGPNNSSFSFINFTTSFQLAVSYYIPYYLFTVNNCLATVANLLIFSGKRKFPVRLTLSVYALE